MQIGIDIDENLYIRLFDNGIEIANDDVSAIVTAIRKGTVFENKIASNNLCSSCTNMGCEFQSGIARTECAFYMPPVTPQPKIGKWIVDGSVDCYLDKVKCHCSECGKKKEFPANYDHIKQKLSISYKYPEFIDNYCPNCGARMFEPQESEGITWRINHHIG